MKNLIDEKIESIKRELRTIEDCPFKHCRTRHDQLLGFLEGLEWVKETN